MLAAYFMEGCDDRPLEQAPDTVDAVGMDVTDAPLFLGVLDCLLARLGLQLVGVDRLVLVRDLPCEYLRSNRRYKPIGDGEFWWIPSFMTQHKRG